MKSRKLQSRLLDFLFLPCIFYEQQWCLFMFPSYRLKRRTQYLNYRKCGLNDHFFPCVENNRNVMGIIVSLKRFFFFFFSASPRVVSKNKQVESDESLCCHAVSLGQFQFQGQCVFSPPWGVGGGHQVICVKNIK